MINIKMTWEQLRGITTENISSVEQRKRRKISNTLEDIDMLNRTPEVETIDRTASYPMTLHVLTRFQCNSNMRIFVWLKLIICCDCSTIVFFSISSEMELKWAENWRILLLFMFEMYCKDKNGEKNKQLLIIHRWRSANLNYVLTRILFEKSVFFRNSLWEFVVHLGNIAFSIQENCCFPKWKLYTVDGEDNL